VQTFDITMRHLSHAHALTNANTRMQIEMSRVSLAKKIALDTSSRSEIMSGFYMNDIFRRSDSDGKSSKMHLTYAFIERSLFALINEMATLSWSDRRIRRDTAIRCTMIIISEYELPCIYQGPIISTNTYYRRVLLRLWLISDFHHKRPRKVSVNWVLERARKTSVPDGSFASCVNLTFVLELARIGAIYMLPLSRQAFSCAVRHCSNWIKR